MILYITVLRALAAILITNAHYTGIYPSDIIANGGLLGDVMFFAVSGFCLCNVKKTFPKWYLHRLVRIYPTVIMATAVYLILGFYSWEGGLAEGVKWFLYPTYYHFVASIVVLYIPFYFVMKMVGKRGGGGEKLLGVVGLLVAVAYVGVYLLVYDKSAYHIDNVREPMIRFLFFESMLIGAHFRINHEKYSGKNKAKNWWMTLVLAGCYFGTKMVFVKLKDFSQFQILNQLVLLALLYFIMRCFAGINAAFEKIPRKMYAAIKYIAEITLEIYVVQYVIIEELRNAGVFPVNWIVVTVAILATASILHMVVKCINKLTSKIV